MIRPTRVATIPGWAYASLFAGFLLLYVLAMPANHIESVDRHAYAMWAETLPLSKLIDTRSILFTVLNRSLFVGAQVLGLPLPASTLISTYSVLAGGGACALMARLLNRHFQLPPAPALLGGALLGLFYGFWRFAMEVEIYVASIFLVLLALSLVLERLSDTRLRAARFIFPGMISGLVVMFYQPNVFPLFLAMPVLFFARDRFLPFFVYGIAGTLTVVVAYVAAFEWSRDLPLSIQSLAAFVGSRNAEFTADPLTIRTVAKLVLAVSHTLLSSNWIFGVESLTEAFQNQFPATETEYKVLAAAHFRPWVYVPLVLIPALVVTFIGLFASARKGRQNGNGRLISYFAAWLVIYGLVAGRLDPGISEVWIPIIPIWVVIISDFLFAPVFRRDLGKLAVVFVGLIGLWNWFGGVGMLKNPDGDFLAHQSAWLKQNATSNDLIILTDSTWKSRTYLAHVLPAEVQSILPDCQPGIGQSAEILETLRQKTAEKGGRVFVFETFVVPSPRLDHVENCPSRRDNAVALAGKVAGNIHPVAGEGVFAVYEIRR